LFVYLVKHLNFDLMHSISFFSRFVFDEFIAKGEEYVHKVGRTLANRVVKRRNMINVYLRGELVLRVLGGVFEFVSLSLSLFFLRLSIFCVIYWFCGFSLF
jgi:hypothetical protein